MRQLLAADVRLAERLDRIVIVPRQRGEASTIFDVLARNLPEERLVRTAEGISVSLSTADRILETQIALNLTWTEEAELAIYNRRRVNRVHPRIYAAVSSIRSGGRVEADKYLEDLPNLEALDDHQRVNVAAMTIPGGPGLCVFDEQGAGKTVTLIHAFDVLVERDEVDFALIVAPKSMVAEWPQDLARFKGDLYRVCTMTGDRRSKGDVLASGADVIVTNFETVVSMESELEALLARFRGRAILVVDESFYAKSLDAKRTRALRRLRERCNRAFVLCGTPAPNAPQDLIQQFNLVDFGITFDGMEIPENREDAHSIIQCAIEERGLYTRHLKKDVLPDLPGKTFERIIVPFSPAQGHAYHSLLDNLVEDLKSVDDTNFKRNLTSYLARRSALLQLCSTPASIIENYIETPAKLAAIDEILRNLIDKEGEKVVLWSFYTASLSAMVERYSRYQPVRYDGTVTDISERREAVRRFQNDRETMLFVANPAAAGAGITLHSAKYAIYESMSNQAAHYLQSLDRIHRRGQARAVQYFILLCEDSIELDEYERLTDKEAAAQQLLGDQVLASPTRESMLSELLKSRERLGGSI